MNELKSAVRSPSQISVKPMSAPRTEPVRRLAVVILDTEEEALLASRILELATPLGLPILLLGVAVDPADEKKVRRKLVTIAAFLREGDARLEKPGSRCGIQIEMQIVQGRDWPTKIKASLSRDDMLACYSEQVVGRQQRPLTDILASSTAAPIYSFSGLRVSEQSRQSMLAQAGAWIASLASIGGCFLVQARIVMSVQGWAQTVLLLVTLFAEAGLIWLVNSLFSQS